MSSPKKIVSFIILIFIAVVLFPNQLTARGKDSTALKRRLIISLGIGDPAMIYIDNFINNGYKFKGGQKVVPQVKPIYAKVEFRVLRHMGIGVDLSYDDYEAQRAPSTSTTFANAYKGYTFVGDIRINRHIHLIKRLDLYFGIGLGYQIQSITNIINTRSLPKVGSNNFAFELTIGGRFYITKRIGIYIEGGIARSILQGGLAVRL